MTSNIGSEHLLEGINAQGEISESARAQVMTALRAHFRPEFLNRVDDTVLFQPLSEAAIAQVVALFLTDLQQRLQEQQIELKVSASATTWIVREGYDAV